MEWYLSNGTASKKGNRRSKHPEGERIRRVLASHAV